MSIHPYVHLYVRMPVLPFVRPSVGHALFWVVRQVVVFKMNLFDRDACHVSQADHIGPKD